MVQLDHGLLIRARSLITDANVHRMKKLIFDYERAVLLHTRRAPEHVPYQRKSEEKLRHFTKQEIERRAKNNRHLHERSQALLRRAADAIHNAERVEALCLDLDERVNEALLLGKDSSSPHAARWKNVD
jgi:hypothetical protein